MYNEKFKKQYLKDKEYDNLSLDKYLLNIFKESESFEESLGKDLYDFSFVEIKRFYLYIGSSSLESINVLNNHLYNYTQAAINQHLVRDNQNHFADFTSDILSTCLNKTKFNNMIITKEELYKLIGSFYNDYEAFFVLALFEGIHGKRDIELQNIKLDDIDEKNKTIKLCTGRDLTFSDRLLKLAISSCNTYEYSLTYKTYKLVDDGEKYALKQMERINSKRDPVKVFYTIKSTYGFLYSQNSIMESGRIDMIKNLMKQDNLSAEETIIKYKAQIEYRYGKINSIPTFLIKYGEFFTEA